METAYLRNGQTGTRISESPASFVRIPNKNEYLWFNNTGYLVLVVHHTWNGNNPVIVLDIIPSQLQHGTTPSATGDPFS